MHIKASYNMHGFAMRTTLNIDEELLKKASYLTGIKEKTLLVKEGLEALVLLENYKRLAKLGGSEPDLNDVRRRRDSDDIS
jgi:Arc/MetJ family transcription regulator